MDQESKSRELWADATIEAIQHGELDLYLRRLLNAIEARMRTEDIDD